MSGSPVVYIDDEPMLCRVFQRILGGTGTAVITFTEPGAAIAYLRDHAAPLIVCDYRMPGMTGLELLAQIPPGTPFFLVSGDLAAGNPDPRVTGTLTKPFRIELLLETVARYVTPPPTP